MYVSSENIFLITTSGRLGIIGGLDLKTAGTDEASFSSVVEADFLTFFTTFLTMTFFFLTGIGASGGSTFAGSERSGGSCRTVGISGGSILRVEIGVGVGNLFAGVDSDIIMELRRLETAVELNAGSSRKEIGGGDGSRTDRYGVTARSYNKLSLGK